MSQDATSGSGTPRIPSHRGGARISRAYLSDSSLERATKMLTTQVGQLGSLIHRYRDEPEVEYALRLDDDALSDVLGILLNERRMRRIEDAEAAL